MTRTLLLLIFMMHLELISGLLEIVQPSIGSKAPVFEAGPSLVPEENNSIVSLNTPLLGVDNRVVLPLNTYLKNLVGQAGEVFSSAPRISLPSPEDLPQALSLAEGSETGGSFIKVVAADQAGPSHQYAGPLILKNFSLESSLKGRIAHLERLESPFLTQDKNGQFWEQVKLSCDQAENQRDYLELLEFENRDLQIREHKHDCLMQFKVIYEDKDNKAQVDEHFKPDVAIRDWFCGMEDTWTAQNGGSMPNDAIVLELIANVQRDLSEFGINSDYYKIIRGELLPMNERNENLYCPLFKINPNLPF